MPEMCNVTQKGNSFGILQLEQIQMINHQIVGTKKKDGKMRFTAVPTVIDKELIQKANDKHYEETKILALQNIAFSDITVLTLSFQNIHKIQNLDGLLKLEKLQLDNNIIEKIENIDHLRRLKWLDLSFNCIKKIEGMNNLTELMDISFYSNEISVVEGLDACTKLNVLSLGNNKIDNLEQMYTYLKKFKRLEVLNIGGNPFIKKEADYKILIMLHLAHLKYLDYTFLDENDRRELKEDDKLRGQLQNEEQARRIEEEKEEEERIRKNEMDRLKEAKIDALEIMLDDIFSTQDVDLERLKRIAGIDEEINKFIDKYKDISVALKKSIFPKHDETKAEKARFMAEYELRIKQGDKETKEIIKEFDHEKKHLFREVDEKGEDPDDRLGKMRDDLYNLDKKLMDVEMECVIMEEEAIGKFDFDLKGLGDTMVGFVSEAFVKLKTEIESLQSMFNKIANEEMDKFAKNPDNPEYDEELAMFLETRDTVTMAIQQYFENTTTKLIKREADMMNAIKDDAKNFIANLRQEQYERNRNNVSNISKLMNELRDEIESKRSQNDDDDSNA